MSSFEDISAMFGAESAKLEDLINRAKTRSELSIQDIVDTYYQVMNVSSMSIMLKEQTDANKQKALLEKITTVDKIISDVFNLDIHPKIMQYLDESIKETTKTLQATSFKPGSQEGAEKDSLLYEKLRRKMSTKEFVAQYDKGLVHD